MLQLNVIDWLTIGAYMALMLVVGIVFARRAGASGEDFFLSGRQLPWWLLGTSMVATTFALDTPLAIAQMIVQKGLYANWIWLSLAVSHLFVTFFLAGRWRRAGVVTDAELCEVRYGGRSAAILRAAKGFFFAFVMNGLTLGGVFFAVKQICYGFGLDVPPGPGEAEALGSNANLALFACLAVALVYSVTSGFWGVVVTDLAQFALAIVGAVMVAWLALADSRVGGLTALVERIRADGLPALQLLPEGLGRAEGLAEARMTLFGFGADDQGLAFVIYLTVMWWAWKFADGGGVLIQRMSAAKDERHATLGTLWFCLAHYVLRWWPWALVGLAAIAVLDASQVAHDPAALKALANQAYPRMIAEVVPMGLRGIVIAYFAAAFMSTVDTHLNLGSAYLVNDLYRRFLVRGRSERHYVWVGRFGCLVILALGLVAARSIQSFEELLAFILNLVAGAGSVFLLRWFWWRINAWSELAALGSSLVIGGGLQLFSDLPFWEVTLANVFGSAVVWLTVTFATRPVDPERLASFVERTRPLGWWRPVRAAANLPGVAFPAGALAAWLASVAACFASVVAVRDLIAGDHGRGGALLAGCALVAVWVVRFARSSALSEPAVAARRA